MIKSGGFSIKIYLFSICKKIPTIHRIMKKYKLLENQLIPHQKFSSKYLPGFNNYLKFLGINLKEKLHCLVRPCELIKLNKK